MISAKITYGLALSSLYVLFIMLLPHRTFRVQGIESDLGYYYVPMARELATRYFADEAYTPREYTWEFHGPVYPMMLLIGSKIFGPGGDWGYFVIAKWLSALAGGSLIFLAVIWLGIPAGMLAALSLGLTSLYTECAFSCGTDLVSVALIFWSAFLLQAGKLRRFGVIVAGFLYAFAVDMRHEYVVLLPFAFIALWMRVKEDAGYPWYHPKQRLSPLWFLLPFLLVVAPDMPRWNGTYNAAFKYKAEDARWQDLWPEEAFTGVETDSLTVSYWGYLIHKTDEKYPSLTAVMLDDPAGNFKIWVRDIFQGLKDIPAVWTLPFLSIVFVLFIARKRSDRRRWTLGRIAFAAVLFHFLMITTFGVYVDRYYLLEIIALTLAGSWAFFRLIPAGNRGSLALLITLPFFYQGGMQTREAISRNIRFNGDRYLAYREIIRNDAGGYHPVMMSRDPGVPFNAGAEWHQFPKGVRDLHKYCLERGIRYIYWGSKEAIFRSEYGRIFDYPDDVEPDYTLLDNRYGLLYRVNVIDE